MHWLLSPVRVPPCDTLHEGRQLLAFHFILVAVARISDLSSPKVIEFCQEEWFQEWMLVEDWTGPAPLLDSVKLITPEQVHQTT
ncbi:14136_t:CDS:1, partial [Acaulospora colombiana]